jgi:hypothetical protein
MFGGPISLFELVTGVAVFWLVRRFFLGLPPDWEPVGTRKFPILLVVDGATSEERESHPVLLARIRSEVHSGEERRRRDHEAAGAPFMLWRFYCYFLSCNLTAFSAKFACLEVNVNIGGENVLHDILDLNGQDLGSNRNVAPHAGS